MSHKKTTEQKVKLLPKEILERMAEVKFYRICETFFKTQGDLTAIFNFIECVSVLGNINIEALKIIAQKLLYSSNIEPTKKEIILLMVLEGIPTREIAKQLRCSKRDISKLTNNQGDNPINIHPKCEPSEMKEILKFIGVFEKIQNIKFR